MGVFNLSCSIGPYARFKLGKRLQEAMLPELQLILVTPEGYCSTRQSNPKIHSYRREEFYFWGKFEPLRRMTGLKALNLMPSSAVSENSAFSAIQKLKSPKN